MARQALGVFFRRGVGVRQPSDRFGGLEVIGEAKVNGEASKKLAELPTQELFALLKSNIPGINEYGHAILAELSRRFEKQ